MYTKKDFRVGQRVRVTLEGTVLDTDNWGANIALPNSGENLLLDKRLSDVVNVEVIRPDPAILPEGTIIHFDVDHPTLTYRVGDGEISDTMSSWSLSKSTRQSLPYTVIYDPTKV